MQPNFNLIQFPEDKDEIHVLAFPGGGVRSCASLGLLQEVERQSGKAWYEIFDAAVGISAGFAALASLSMQANDIPLRTVEESITMIENFGKTVLHKDYYYRLYKSGLGKDTFLCSKKKYDYLLNNYGNTTTLSDVVCPIYGIFDDLTRERLCVIPDENNYTTADAVSAVTAAQFLFTPQRLISTNHEKSFSGVDSGPLINNPFPIIILSLLGIQNPNLKVHIWVMGNGGLNVVPDFSKKQKWNTLSWIDGLLNLATAQFIKAEIAPVLSYPENEAKILQHLGNVHFFDFDIANTGIMGVFANNNSISGIRRHTKRYVKESEKGIELALKHHGLIK
ncbi:MAG: hypothetical protein S4CHLAM102_16220 [Chlamydiia bacterium]|nr:hypothetical protein [Chlamydiia bacterium]